MLSILLGLLTVLYCLEVPLTCSDGLLDGDETAIDCGGSCEGCGLGSTCVRRDDCGEGTC